MAQTQGIHYYNRYTGQIEQEKVLGEAAMRWIYGTTPGKVSLHVLLKRAFVSRMMGWQKNTRRSAKGLAEFVRQYGINMEEVALPLESFRSFNEFFYRELKPGARPLCAENEVALPADGRHSGWQDATEIRNVFVKGQSFDLPALLGSAELAEKYAHGTIVLSRLCPVDYHRFHFCTGGTPEAAIHIPGPLASVSPYCLRQRLSWLWTNKRERTLIRNTAVGDVVSLAVGATGVGAIFQTYTPGCPMSKGDEQGYFAFGGSTVMTFFEPGRVQLAADILENTARCTETYAHMGDTLGSIIR